MTQEANPYGKISRFSITTASREGLTILEDFSYTSPFKIMRPFPLKNGGIQVMMLAASPGVMAGDLQEFSFHIKEGSLTEFVSQSYDKIHYMEQGQAQRNTSVYVEKGGTFYFHPQPMIPFKGSAFESQMTIQLEDETSRFFMSEILSCGRYARGEKFAYRFYHNLVQIYRKKQLIYRDNTRYDPLQFKMDSLGMYESYTHLACIFLTPPLNPDSFSQQVCQLLKNTPDVTGGATRLPQGDMAVRILGQRGQVLEELSARILDMAF